MPDATAISADAVADVETSHPHQQQFDDLSQQTEAARLGMWLFLATEVLFFGGLFAAYTVYRFVYPRAFAEASRELSVLFGTLDTAVLLASSLTMAFAVFAAQSMDDAKRQRAGQLVAGWLLATAALGVCFLVLHGIEYHGDWQEHHFPGSAFYFAGAEGEQAQLFFLIYFLLTGLHSVHVFIGVCLLSVMAWRAWHSEFSRVYHNPVEVSGLYWHFVDMVWVFLFPLLYLIAPR